MSVQDENERLRRFYDEVYYGKPGKHHGDLTWHHRVIAKRLKPREGSRVLDVACGLGQWLGLLEEHGASVAGVDISDRAVAECSVAVPTGEFHVSSAEALPFPDGYFDLVTCMGSLEHFPDKPAALREMIRVAKPDARFLLLVPNSGFLPLRLGLFAGTWQASVREDIFDLETWAALFESTGLRVEHRWRDLHVLDLHWINKGRLWARPFRLVLALMLASWPMSWQYQVHHLCRRNS